MAANREKDSPEGYCAALHKKISGKFPSENEENVDTAFEGSSISGIIAFFLDQVSVGAMDREDAYTALIELQRKRPSDPDIASAVRTFVTALWPANEAELLLQSTAMVQYEQQEFQGPEDDDARRTLENILSIPWDIPGQLLDKLALLVDNQNIKPVNEQDVGLIADVTKIMDGLERRLGNKGIYYPHSRWSNEGQWRMLNEDSMTQEFDAVLQNVAIFTPGTHTDSLGTEKTFSREDLEHMVDAFNRKAPPTIPVKMGHSSDEFNQQVADAMGIPAVLAVGEGSGGKGQVRLGEITALHLNDTHLTADLRLSDKVGQLVKDKLFTGVSAEIQANRRQGEEVFPTVLSGLALLGAQRPALADLPTLQQATMLDDGSSADNVFTFDSDFAGIETNNTFAELSPEDIEGLKQAQTIIDSVLAEEVSPDEGLTKLQRIRQNAVQIAIKGLKVGAGIVAFKIAEDKIVELLNRSGITSQGTNTMPMSANDYNLFEDGQTVVSGAGDGDKLFDIPFHDFGRGRHVTATVSAPDEITAKRTGLRVVENFLLAATGPMGGLLGGAAGLVIGKNLMMGKPILKPIGAIRGLIKWAFSEEPITSTSEFVFPEDFNLPTSFNVPFEATSSGEKTRWLNAVSSFVETMIDGVKEGSINQGSALATISEVANSLNTVLSQNIGVDTHTTNIASKLLSNARNLIALMSEDESSNQYVFSAGFAEEPELSPDEIRTIEEAQAIIDGVLAGAISETEGLSTLQRFTGNAVQAIVAGITAGALLAGAAITWEIALSSVKALLQKARTRRLEETMISDQYAAPSEQHFMSAEDALKEASDIHSAYINLRGVEGAETERAILFGKIFQLRKVFQGFLTSLEPGVEQAAKTIDMRIEAMEKIRYNDRPRYEEDSTYQYAAPEGVSEDAWESCIASAKEEGIENPEAHCRAKLSKGEEKSTEMEEKSMTKEIARILHLGESATLGQIVTAITRLQTQQVDFGEHQQLGEQVKELQHTNRVMAFQEETKTLVHTSGDPKERAEKLANLFESAGEEAATDLLASWKETDKFAAQAGNTIALLDGSSDNDTSDFDRALSKYQEENPTITYAEALKASMRATANGTH